MKVYIVPIHHNTYNLTFFSTFESGAAQSSQRYNTCTLYYSVGNTVLYYAFYVFQFFFFHDLFSVHTICACAHINTSRRSHIAAIRAMI